MTKVDEFMKIIERLILERQLKIGDQLPPERELSKTYGYSRQTVHNGLIRLSEMNLLSIVPRQGVFVKDYMKSIDFKLLDVFLDMEKSSFGEMEKEGIVEFIRCNLHFILKSLSTSVDSNELRKYVADLIKAPKAEEKEEVFYQFFKSIVVSSNNIMSIMLFNAFEKGFKNVAHYALLDAKSVIKIIKWMEEMIKGIEKGQDVSCVLDALTDHVMVLWKEG